MRYFKISLYLAAILLFLEFNALAQDDLLELLEEETSMEEEIDYTYATFKTTRIINGQSIETTSGGVLNFIIAHRFGKISDGAYEFFGLDQSTIRLGLEYGITDNFNIGIGRSSFLKTVDGYVKYKFLKQSTGKKNVPLTIVFYSNMAIDGTKWSEPERENYFSSRMSFASQLLIARKFSNAFSLQLTPGFVHRNLVETTEDQNDILAIGFGGRYKLSNRVSVNAEYFYQLPGTNADKTSNSVSLGFDIETGGHIFQLHMTNSKGMIEQYFIPNTTGKITDGDIYFGFNINRVFTISKKNR
ncbi:DUF5777 family beta-barrel protein [Bacteroidota bacterium]